MKGVVLRVTCEEVLKAFSPEPCVVSTQKPVVATCHEKLFTLVKASPVPEIWEMTNTQTDTHTHPRNTAMNIINEIMVNINEY